MDTLKVLVVDDDLSIQVFLKNVLEKDNFSVTLASSGEQALEILSELDPDIVLMDVSMPPGISGYDTCEIIRSNPDHAYLPIMVVTGLDDDESINKAYTVGATDFTTKPINAALIGHRIRYVIRSSGNAISLKKAEKHILALNKNLEKLVQKRTLALQEALDDLKTTQKELIESAKIASLGQLVSGIAHEMNTPLGIAISAVSYVKTELDSLQKILIKKYGADEEITNSIALCFEAKDLAENNMHRASLLIKTFRNISADQRTSDKAEFEVKTFLQELLNGIKNKKGGPITVTTILECPDDLKITTYPDVFLEIISALILNSLQHGFEGKTTGTIKIIVTPENKRIEILYEDNGVGFPKGSEHKIFEPFFTTKRGGGHPGLGLHIAYNYIKQTLKGDISYVPSEAGQSGVKFLIEIPKLLV